MAATSFFGTYAPTSYHHLAPNVSRKLTTLGQNLAVPSTCNPFAALHTTTTSPQCQLSASVSQTSYPVLCRVCIPCSRLVSCRNPKSTFPCCSARSAVSIPHTCPIRMFSDDSLIPCAVPIPFQNFLVVVRKHMTPPVSCLMTSRTCRFFSLCVDHSPVLPFPNLRSFHVLPRRRFPVCLNTRPIYCSEAFVSPNGFLTFISLLLLDRPLHQFYRRRFSRRSPPPPSVVRLADLRSGRAGQEK